jgi:ATP/maltotriose-dependent transcriptional regulator MalT
MWGDEVIAVIELISREDTELTERLKRSLVALGYVLGYFFAHRRGILNERVITGRQVEILELAAQGLSRREIAERLHLSTSTVKTHFENSYARLGVKNRAAAVAKAVRLGLVD